MTDGQELSQILKDLEWSQAHFARKVEVSPGTVYNWCYDKCRLPGAVKLWLDLLLKVRKLSVTIRGLENG